MLGGVVLMDRVVWWLCLGWVVVNVRFGVVVVFRTGVSES